MRNPAFGQCERDVVRLVARGLENKEIAEHLGVKERMVKGLVEVARTKLGASNRTHLAALGVAGISLEHHVLRG